MNTKDTDFRPGEYVWHSQNYKWLVLWRDDLKDFGGGMRPWELIGIDSGNVRRCELIIDTQWHRRSVASWAGTICPDQLVADAPAPARKRLLTALDVIR
jgi:hypothetical protein